MKAIRIYELKDGRYLETGHLFEDGRYSGSPGPEGTARLLAERHGMEGAARRLSTGPVQAALEVG